MIVLQPPLLSKGWGCHLLCLSWDSPVLMDLHWPCGLQLNAVFCPLVQHLSFFCEAFFLTILDSSSFSLFHNGEVFHKLICPLTVVPPQIFFNLASLFSCPVFFCLFSPQWGAADAEIKVPSGENTELKRPPFKAQSRSVYRHTCYAYCQGFLSCLFLPFQSIHLYFFHISRFLCWLWLTWVPG